MTEFFLNRLKSFMNHSKGPKPTHSSSDQQLTQLVVVGANDKQIAQCLGLSTKEVRLWIDDLLKRLGLTERIELILYAYSQASRSQLKQVDAA
jgi:DNA-binding NarL/FixJ family response regulator